MHFFISFNDNKEALLERARPLPIRSKIVTSSTSLSMSPQFYSSRFLRFASPASPTIPSAAPNNATEADCSSPVEGSSGAGGVTGVCTASLSVADSEVSLDAEQVEDIGAVEADPFFSAGLLVSVDATFRASSDFFVSAFSSFLDSAFASLFPVAAGVSEVTAELDRSTFGAGAPSA